MSENEIYYLRQISADLDNNFFKSPWGGIVMKNANEFGELLTFKSKDNYKSQGKKLWLYLSLKIFKHEGGLHVVYCCNECDSMKGVDRLQLDVDPDTVKQLLCFHSRTASFLLPRWHNVWDIEVPRFVSAFSVKCNQHLNYFKFQDRSKDKTLLAGVWVDGCPHLIVTVTKRQSVPFCSTCDSLTCTHQKAFDARQKKDNPTDFNSRMQNAQENPDNLDGEHREASEERDDLDDVDIDPDVGEEEVQNRHYLDLPPLPLYHKMYGYNMSKILYPYERSKAQQDTWLKRVRNIYDFPEAFVPIWSVTNKCSHGFGYDPDDDNMILESKSILVYHNIGEQVFNVKNYIRKSLNSCKCLLRTDTHPYFLWNLGSGRFVNYTLLNSYLHMWKNSGLSIHAQFKSVLEMSSSAGISSTMKYNDLHRSICGYFVQLSFDEKVAFSCPRHGRSPVWINTDGKCTGPAKKRVKDVNELDRHPEDAQVLKQSTVFKDRVFLPDFAERTAVCDLVTGKSSYEEFLMTDIQTENGLMISDLVTYLSDEWPEEPPKPYMKFLSNISKGTSVRGLLQVSNSKPLKYLKSYCEQTVNIREPINIKKLQVVISELPAFWPILDNICMLENSAFLPDFVSRIVIKLLVIRKSMFANMADRNPEDYIAWEGREHQTMCYPNLKLFRYPKKVEVNKKKDADLCRKEFQSHADFTAGIFSLGCACEYNTTLGMYF